MRPDSRFQTVLKFALLIVVLLIVFRIHSMVTVLTFPYGDLYQDFVLGCAIRDGSPLGLSRGVLSEVCLSFHPDMKIWEPGYWHPAPHPPILGILFAPLTVLTIEIVAYGWLFLQLVLMTWVVAVLLGCSGPARMLFASVIYLLLLCSLPIRSALEQGQVNIVLLALITAAVLSVRGGQFFRAGCWIGVGLSTKVVGWPILLLAFFDRRYYRTIGGATCTYIALRATEVLIVGYQEVIQNLFVTLPLAVEVHKYDSMNLSLSVLLASWMMASGFPSELVMALKGIFVATFVGYALLLSRNLETLGKFGLLLSAAATVSPLAWIGTFCPMLLLFLEILSKTDFSAKRIILALVGLLVWGYLPFFVDFSLSLSPIRELYIVGLGLLPLAIANYLQRAGLADRELRQDTPSSWIR